MNINKTIKVGNRIVNISVDNCSQSTEQSNTYFSSTSAYTKESFIEFNDDSVIIQNDSCGLFRVYYWMVGDDIYIANNIFNYLSKKDLMKFDKDSNEYEYYQNHGYTTGANTYYTQIKKVAPSCRLTITKNGISIDEDFTLYNQEATPDKRTFCHSVYSQISDTLSRLSGIKEKIILCYSGGTDSHYLASIMLEQRLEFECVYFFSKKSNIKDLEYAKQRANQIGLSLHVLDVDSKIDEVEDIIAERMIFDKHVAYPHFYGTRKIVEKWGKEVVVVNGQNSDGIFSFGPSERKFSSFLKRYTIYGKLYALKWVFSKIVSFSFKQNLKIPTSDHEKAVAMFSNFKYCLFLNLSIPKEIEYTTKLIKKIIMNGSFNNLRKLLMYVKINTFIQGSDSQVVVQSANANSVKLLLPFASKEVVEATLKYKYDYTELFNPKYALKI